MEAKKTLRETVDMMLSEDKIEQFKAEYYQLENRLIALNEKIMAYDLDPENAENRLIANERNIMGEKMNHMRSYLYTLQREAKIKEIDL